MESRVIWLMSIVLGGAIAAPNFIAESGHLADERSANATKKGIVSFGLMVWRVTNRNPIDFNGYGCWCGIGGKGKPVDDLDRCCLVHDICYHQLMQSNVCPSEKAVYFMPYSTKRNHPAKCEPPSHYWFSGECRFRLCECDAAAAECFKKNRYDEKYREHPQSKCTNDKPPELVE
ncbi:phospholipase A2 A2-actitoxin-Cgg2a-like isoform X1 [Stylophora pistillata]|uniref:phospholipase A2 A2-actitoxin-Cgg2a-like isoform X1 n=1 Tax=Stylophora pistillata TaxID=50429 RepID=UPI000C0511DD|nr:phospholipase A2 A2-actitoxin-Cgg2a-like isoform X1 [Stylophora pistillata]